MVVPSAQPAHAESLGQWTSITPYGGAEFSGATCLTSGGYIYCLGGGTDNEQGSLDGLTVYAPLSSSTGAVGAWTGTTAYPNIDGITGESCVISGGYIYCVGGASIYFEGGITVDTIYNETYYAPISPTTGGIGGWSPTTSYPSPVDNTECMASGGYIYCLGGSLDLAGDANDAAYYAPLTSSGIGAWTMTTGPPNGVKDYSCAVGAGAFVYCSGGDTTAGSLTSIVSYAPLSSTGVGLLASTTSYPSAGRVRGMHGGVGLPLLRRGSGWPNAATDDVYYALTSPSGGSVRVPYH